MSGEVANNSPDNRALNATTWPGVRWVNDYNGCKESHYWKPVLHGDLQQFTGGFGSNRP
jgi:hypothetical protein